MSVRFCPRCRRACPEEAAYCYFDGQDLRLVMPGQTDPWQLGKEFVFPSGQRCRTFDELVDACMGDWPAARELLRRGAFQQFFSSIGRADVAQVVWQAVERHLDADEALDYLLTRLPTKEPVRPALDYSPRKLQFGRVLAGDKRTLILRISNKGKGLLRGRIRLEGVSWLTIQSGENLLVSSETPLAYGAASVAAPAPNGPTNAANFAHPSATSGSQTGTGHQAPNDAPAVEVLDDDVPLAELIPSAQPYEQSYTISTWTTQEVRIVASTENLPAGQIFHATLILETNGGTVEVPVEIEVSPVPFPDEPFRGITEPKYLAAQMRLHAREAARLLREGAIRQWFETNHWVWPVIGDTAPGIAAVQQFYEALGVNKPPRLEIEPVKIECTLQSEEPRRFDVLFRSPDPKWVYAKITSTEPWLEAEPTMIYGPQRAYFSLTVLPAALPGPGRYETQVQIEGNGGQRLTLPVRVEYAEAPLPAALWMFLGSLVGALAASGLRLLVSWPDLLFRPQQFGSLLVQATAPWLRVYSWCQAATVGLLIGCWSAWKFWRRERAFEAGFLGLIGGGLLGVILGFVVAALLRHTEPVLSQLLNRASPFLAQFPLISVAVWYIFGTILGAIVACCGEPGRSAIRWLAREYARLFKLLGWKKLARFFSLRWD
jgi:hypothetical protein